MYGFRYGPRGVFTGKYVKIDDKFMDQYRNMGGFDMIGSGRDKIKGDDQVRYLCVGLICSSKRPRRFATIWNWTV